MGWKRISRSFKKPSKVLRTARRTVSRRGLSSYRRAASVKNRVIRRTTTRPVRSVTKKLSSSVRRPTAVAKKLTNGTLYSISGSSQKADKQLASAIAKLGKNAAVQSKSISALNQRIAGLSRSSSGYTRNLTNLRTSTKAGFSKASAGIASNAKSVTALRAEIAALEKRVAIHHKKEDDVWYKSDLAKRIGTVAISVILAKVVA